MSMYDSGVVHAGGPPLTVTLPSAGRFAFDVQIRRAGGEPAL
jgi:hypothetical protein